MSDETKEIAQLWEATKKQIAAATTAIEEAPLNLVRFTPYESILGDPVSWDVNFAGNGNYVGIVETYMSAGDGQYMFTDTFRKTKILDTLDDVYEFLAEEYNPETAH